MCSRVFSPQEFSALWHVLYTGDMEHDWDKLEVLEAFRWKEGSGDNERLGVETDLRFRESRRWGGFPLAIEVYCYILTVRGSASLKLRVDSVGRTISSSPV